MLALSQNAHAAHQQIITDLVDIKSMSEANTPLALHGSEHSLAANEYIPRSLHVVERGIIPYLTNCSFGMSYERYSKGEMVPVQKSELTIREVANTHARFLYAAKNRTHS